MAYFAEELPLKWIQLENELVDLRDFKTNVVPFCNILDLAKKLLIKDEELRSFLKYQHKIGNIIFLENIRDYHDDIILDPNWLIKCFRCLVYDNNITKRTIIDLLDCIGWNQLKKTGELSDANIIRHFEKEPSLEFETCETDLLDMMTKFEIIVKPSFILNNDALNISYYMPCMIKKPPTPLETIRRRFTGEKSNEKNTSPWLILEFDFLPLAYINHILFYFINNYSVCENTDGTTAIYRGKALFYIDDTEHRKLVICFSKNAISLQIWGGTGVCNDTYRNILDDLCCYIQKLNEKFRQITSYAIKAKCSTGDYSITAGRISFVEFIRKCIDENYICDEHGVTHSKTYLENTWFQHIDIVSKFVIVFWVQF